VQFLDDSYNANPDSMKAALRTLVELDSEGQRIAVLGEMRELGDESQRGHHEVGETAAMLKVDHLIAIGNVAATIAEAAKRAGLENSSTVASTAEAAELLVELARPGDLVLIKGSRLARTEQVIDAFRDRRTIAATSP
jgi:UDP-N-acetylmuramoyl-tripeptide--D-alanyl-D-alanine ligase